MSKRILTILLVLVTAGAVAAGCGGDEDSSAPKKSSDDTAMQKSDDAMDKSDDAMDKPDDAMDKSDDTMMKFDNVESPHFVSSNPANNATVAAGSVKNVVLTFDFDLADGSKISVMHDGDEVTTGDATIGGDDLRLSVPVNASADGAYQVAYTACWPDGSCHDGSFGFNVKG